MWVIFKFVEGKLFGKENTKDWTHSLLSKLGEEILHCFIRKRIGKKGGSIYLGVC
jgi:hypothetical protein